MQMGYSAPSEIQEKAIPALGRGRDVVGQAQTGSGKTAAFGIPLVERLERDAGTGQGIVLVPTRELAVQVADEIASIGRTRGLSTAAVYGGQPIATQIRRLNRGAEVVVGTPGRLMDHVRRGNLSLDNVRVAVLDEADRMLDVGFAEDMEWILSRTPSARQTALFSATIPGFLRRLIRRYMRDPEWIRIGTEIQTVDEVEQFYVEVADRDKLNALGKILSELPEGSQSLIFCRMQVDVDRLIRQLRAEGFAVSGLHGGMPQSERNRVMTAFREQSISCLASTNLAARGIDIPTISHVINFDVPDNTEDYVHRIGRTARMGRKGVAVTFVGEWDLDAFDKISAQLGERLKPYSVALYA